MDLKQNTYRANGLGTKIESTPQMPVRVEEDNPLAYKLKVKVKAKALI